MVALSFVAGLSLFSLPAQARAATATLALVGPTVLSYPGQELPFREQQATLAGNLGVAGVRSVTLQYYASGWKTFATAQSADDGSFSFTNASTTGASRRFRVYAPKASGAAAISTAEVVRTTQTDAVSLAVIRVGDELRFTGQASPVVEGRGFTLQYRKGSAWRTLVDGLVEDVDGALTATSTFSGSKTYRLLGEELPGSRSVTSAARKFTSPARLGTNVIYVTTDSGALPKVRGVDYTGTATIVSGSTATSMLPLETIAVRGNTSATKPKKGFKLRFIDKQKPFGMKSDKAWNLLPNYEEHSLVRNKISLDLARAQVVTKVGDSYPSGMTWAADSRFAEVFINGVHRGSYQLAQSVKIDSNRVPADNEAGQIVEVDPGYLTEDVPGLRGQSGLPFTFKDPDEWEELSESDGGVWDATRQQWLDPEGLTTAKVTAVTRMTRTFEAVLYGRKGKRNWATIDPSTLPECSWADVDLTTSTLSQDEWQAIGSCDWEDFLDLGSAVDYILVKEFTKDTDADFYRSNFFYVEDDTDPDGLLRMGPVWDFDRGAGAHGDNGTGVQEPKGWWTDGSGRYTHRSHTIHWFARIWKDPRFKAAMKARWNDQKAFYAAVPATGVELAVAQLGDPAATSGATTSLVASNDRARWLDGRGSSRPKAKTYAGEIAWLKQWYADRYAWMDSKIQKF